jgi:tRNA(Ile)-lysidine synthetase-like protein
MLDYNNYNNNYLPLLIGIISTITAMYVVLNYVYIERSKYNKQLQMIKHQEQTLEKNKYQYLLESPKDYVFEPEYINSIDKIFSPLVKCLDDFCQTNHIYEKGAIVSLSGGVDSMVTLAILLHLQKTHQFPIFTASIDYGLRDESLDESNFLNDYTKIFGIKSYISYVKGVSRKKEDSGSRSEFEEESKNLRFNTYKQIIEENQLDSELGVFVAHHHDDIVENIFTNSMRGANLLDLEVMKPISKIYGVNIFRPFLGFKKQIIYDFAHKYRVPYFLDTTPKWSKRGKMRNEIFPLLDSVFGVDWRNKLKQLGTQSNEWGEYINIYVLTPWFKEVQLGQSGIIIPIKEQPQLIYSNIIMKSLHSIGEHMLKKNSINKIMVLINKKPSNNYTPITLDSFRYGMLIKDNQYLIIFNSNNVNSGSFVSGDVFDGLINGVFDETKCDNSSKSIKKIFTQVEKISN